MCGGCALREWRGFVKATVEHGVVTGDSEKQKMFAKMTLGQGCRTEGKGHNMPLSLMIQFPLEMVSNPGWDQKRRYLEAEGVGGEV